MIYNDSADKAARFILNCSQKKIPLVFTRCHRFYGGAAVEHAGIIKDGAKLVNAVANPVVPKITIIIGNHMVQAITPCAERLYDPRFIYAWPSAKIAVMGGSRQPRPCSRYRSPP